ncbi:MAG TPA: PQQ-dependent sugar dehydrogenase, partial [Polyangiaceae bacterium]|nr:PQQ-dependent sugar dehydrogenase [Polyangiaceae bacterium]
MTRAALLFGLLLSFGSVPAHAAELAEGEPADAFDLETVVDGLAEPTDVAILPDGRVVVTQRLGDITIVLPDGGQIWNHIDVVAEAGHQGLLGVVADPNFATNEYLYFYASLGDADNRHKVVRIPLNENNELGELTYIIEYGLFGPKNHEGGGLIIDGNHLYVSVGDAGFNRTPPDNRLATCLNWPNGKILRVNLDGSIPEDNPLTDVELATGCTWWDQPLELYPPDTRVYAWGLRNPFRFSVDSKTGLLWVGDVGESAREKIAVGGRGDHFGWPYREGSVEYEEDWHPEDTCEGVTPARECVPVAHEYAHESGNDCVIGGLILDACGWPEEW